MPKIKSWTDLFWDTVYIVAPTGQKTSNLASFRILGLLYPHLFTGHGQIAKVTLTAHAFTPDFIWISL